MRSIPACLLLGLIGCTQPTTAPEATSIEGTWRWVRSVERSPLGQEFSPSTEDVTAELSFGPDGRFVYSQSDAVPVEGGYSLSNEEGARFVAYDRAYPFSAQQQWLVIWTDSLRLVDATVGGYETVYVRLR